MKNSKENKVSDSTVGGVKLHTSSHEKYLRKLKQRKIKQKIK